MKKTHIHTDKAPAAIGPYVQASRTVEASSTLYVSGQLGIVPSTGELAEGIQAQVEQAFDNLQAIIETAGGKLSDVLKLTLFVTDLANFAVVNQVMAARFAEPYPARSTIEVKGLPKGGLFEVEAIVAL